MVNLIQNYILFIIQQRSITKLFTRGISIWRRYGLNIKKFQMYLATYQDILKKYNVTPTFPITAVLIKRYPQFVHTNNGNIDFAIHGYHHVDYKNLSLKKQKKEIEEAIKLFQKMSIPFFGFRCPYLRWNAHTFHALQEKSFSWDSSHSILWDSIEKELPDDKVPVYREYLSLYNFKNSSKFISLPHLVNNIIEIPVTLPDDDLLIDRLDIRNSKRISNIWQKILFETYAKGELFVLQLHPERILLCKDALKLVLEASKNHRPTTWIASLSEINNWWKEKIGFSFKIREINSNKYSVNATCSKNSTLLIKNTKPECPTEDFFNSYKIVKKSHFIIKSSKRPSIGVSRDASLKLTEFLRNEGFLFEISDKKQEYGIYFDNDMNIQNNERNILHFIEQSEFPTIRYWRWPYGAQNALVVTGDIDALTSIDFFLRLFGG